MMQTIGYVALVVRGYDEAVRFFTESLGFKLIEDTPLGQGKRWILVGPPNSRGTPAPRSSFSAGASQPNW
jgi:catechol 2,3-dioxygenase-like lactoylglutathione lyase family enzyme